MLSCPVNIMMNFYDRLCLFTGLLFVTSCLLIPCSALSQPLTLSAKKIDRSIGDRIEIGGEILNLPNYQTPESCEQVAIKFVERNDSTDPQLTPPTKVVARNNSCRYILQVPGYYAGKKIAISISPTAGGQSNTSSSTNRAIIFVVPSDATADRSVTGPTFEF
jgi:hypothetical protein